jgi:RNA processing factor Prp31
MHSFDINNKYEKKINNKFDNHVYMLICEITLKLFKESLCMNHSSYCRLIKASLIDNNLSKKEVRHIAIISDRLEKIFSFTAKESGEYVSNYFMLDKFEKFEESIRATNNFFPNSGDII